MSVPEHGLTKAIWTDADYEQMGWHDSRIHGFYSEILPQEDRWDYLFDLDYIVRWVHPAHSGQPFSFWLAPATLAFHNAYDVTIQLKGIGDLLVETLERSDEQLTPNGNYIEYLWQLHTGEGTISLRATGYTQYFRRWPVLTQHMWFTTKERGGLSFNRQMKEQQ